MSGEQANDAIVARLPKAAPAAKAVLLRLLSARSDAKHQDVVLAATADANDEVRTAALDALGVLAEGRSLPTLIERLNAAKSGAERDAAERAVATSASRAGAAAQVGPTIVTAMQNAPRAGGQAVLSARVGQARRSAGPGGRSRGD